MEISGSLADHPRAREFAEQVQRVHRRYADEIVGAFRLCPFFRDAESAFGRFCVVLDPVPDLDRALAAATAAEGVAHLVFPLAGGVEATAFERFGGALGRALKVAMPRSPVMATFHPHLSGDSSTSHRLVGLLRRAPDPFVQLVPAGLHQGGTVFAGSVDELPPDHAQQTFERVSGAQLQRLLDTLSDIREDRDRSYASFELARAAGAGGGPGAAAPPASSGIT
jgi:hypothetical protein